VTGTRGTTSTPEEVFRNSPAGLNPRRHLRTDVPAVLSIALPRRIDSARFKEIVHPSPHIWMHHLELRTADDLDAEVAGWLTEAYEAAA
jgi:hypothetical protein